MRIDVSWSEFKNQIDNKNLTPQYIDKGSYYFIYTQDDKVIYVTSITKSSGNEDQAEFEESYKVNAPNTPRSLDKKHIVRAESRPLDCTTYFTCRGDSESEIGDGTPMNWDFSNSDDEVSMPSGSGLKRKRIKVNFLDAIYLKEGALYYQDAKKGSYADLYIVCPSGQYYLDNAGIPKLASEDTKIAHFVVNHFLFGDVPMGDELNSETCSEEIPAEYEIWIEITVPEEDNNSHGFAQLEMFRKRTKVL